MPPTYRTAADVRAIFERLFPNLSGTQWSIKSPFDDSYQCIAWAACRTDQKWWPNLIGFYWPLDAPSDGSVDCFVQVFSKNFGYKSCDSAAFEFGYQKVTIYANDAGVTHMARQHFLGKGWLSKAGDMEDIIHRYLVDIEGNMSPMACKYGRVTQVLKRSWWSALVRLCLFRCFWNALKFWLYRLRNNYAT